MDTLSRVSFGAMATVVVGANLWIIRPWQLRWAVIDAEVHRLLPGDEIVPQPMFNATRVVTIKARPEAIWPWLVQMGTTRAGWYS